MSQWTDYLDFTGSILSGVIGGLMTYYGVKLTLDRTQKDKQEEDNRTSIKDVIKLIKIVEAYARQALDNSISFIYFFDKYPSFKKYEDSFTNHLLHDSQNELGRKANSKAKECVNAFENVYYDALETASLIDRKALLSVTNTFNEIRKNIYSKAITKPVVTFQDQFEFLQANYELLKLMYNLLGNLQNELTDRLDIDLHDYYKEYKE